ncbi:putative acetyltransferase [Acorus calamus]|uniref:Acetyltransferase n=1 Tax=Acorus calamus TaxID=4465 RepID=A0AAV9EGA5_ACOCL|nr:putative acetyltransferase [Acorus calamus]
MESTSPVVKIISKCTVTPSTPSTLGHLKLSVSDLPMLSCHYIQKGLLFPDPPIPIERFLSLLKSSLSLTLSHFPALAGNLSTDPTSGVISISCSDSGAHFIHANADSLSLSDILSDARPLFALDGAVSHDGHRLPISAFQVTVLSDGLFVAASVNHAVTDGTSFWNFFNSWSEITRAVSAGGAASVRIFHFSREAVQELKSIANDPHDDDDDRSISAEIMGKSGNDTWQTQKSVISSFQSLSALLWRGVTRARRLSRERETTFRMAVNCRARVEPKVSPNYFGNAIQSIPTVASVGSLLEKRGHRWAAEQLRRSVAAHDNEKVVRGVRDFEKDPKCFPLGNPDGTGVTMGSSPWFPMYDNDFGWGRPLAVRSGRANKFDGKISAFPGRDVIGSVDLEVCLSPETMARLEMDEEFMHYVSQG